MFKKKIFIIILLIVISSISFSNVRIIPPLLFTDEPKKSTSFSLINITEKEIEVWIETRYGYVTSNDSDQIYIEMRENYESDDQSCLEFTTVYPNKFILKPTEKRYVRIIVNPPPQLKNGEYWLRLLINSKPLEKKLTAIGSEGSTRVGLEIQNQQSVPFHYRKGRVTTSVDLIETPSIKIINNELNFTGKFQRYGNSSFWGRMYFELKDSKGKTVKTYFQNLVVYKKIVLNYRFDISKLPKGKYTLYASAETKRSDEASRYLIKTEPKTWKYIIDID